jgi:hypothetical protein
VQVALFRTHPRLFNCLQHLISAGAGSFIPSHRLITPQKQTQMCKACFGRGAKTPQSETHRSALTRRVTLNPSSSKFLPMFRASSSPLPLLNPPGPMLLPTTIAIFLVRILAVCFSPVGSGLSFPVRFSSWCMVYTVVRYMVQGVGTWNPQLVSSSVIVCIECLSSSVKLSHPQYPSLHAHTLNPGLRLSSSASI